MALGRDLQVHGAVLDERDGRDLKVEFEGRFLDNRDGNAFIVVAVEGACVVDLDVVNALGKGSGESALGILDVQMVESPRDFGLGSGLEDHRHGIDAP